jgi:hypothetical protein
MKRSIAFFIDQMCLCVVLTCEKPHNLYNHYARPEIDAVRSSAAEANETRFDTIHEFAICIFVRRNTLDGKNAVQRRAAFLILHINCFRHMSGVALVQNRGDEVDAELSINVRAREVQNVTVVSSNPDVGLNP